MPRTRQPPADPRDADLFRLTNVLYMVWTKELAQCSALLSLLPETIGGKEISGTDRPSVLYEAMRAVEPRAWADYADNDKRITASAVMSAAALIGLVPELREEYGKKRLDERGARKSSREDRLKRAASWHYTRVGIDQYRRRDGGLNSYEDESLASFRETLIKILNDDETMQSIAERLSLVDSLDYNKDNTSLIDNAVMKVRTKPTKSLDYSQLIEFARYGLEAGGRVSLHGVIGQDFNELPEGIASSVIRSDLIRLAREHKFSELVDYLEDDDSEYDFFDRVRLDMVADLSIVQVTTLPRDYWIIEVDGSRPDRFLFDLADFLFAHRDSLPRGTCESQVWKLSVDELLRVFRYEFIEDNPVPAPAILVDDLSDDSQVAEFLDYLNPQRLIATTHHSLSKQAPVSFDMPALSDEEVRELLTNELDEQTEVVNAAESMIPWLEGNCLAAEWTNEILCRFPWRDVAEKIEFINRCTATAEDLAFRSDIVKSDSPTVSISLRTIGYEVIKEFQDWAWTGAADDAEALLEPVFKLSTFMADSQVPDPPGS